MTIPADYGSPKRIITMALRDCGKLAADTEADSALFLDGMQRLADLLYYHQTKGLKLWLLEDITVPLVVSKSLYTFGPGGDVDMRKPFRVEFGYATQDPSQQNRRPLIPLSYEDWTRLSNISQEGLVTQYFADKQKDLLKVHLWLTPDATQVAQGGVHLVMRTKAEHLVNLTETMTFPPEWYLALRWALAAELASSAPLAVQQRCEARAAKFIEDLEGFDIEDVPVLLQADLMQAYSRTFN